jgi:hypothetical protein
MQEIPWFERKQTFGAIPEMLPYFIERLSDTMARIEAMMKDDDHHLVKINLILKNEMSC